MTTEYRFIFTGTFTSSEERAKAVSALETAITATIKDSATFKRADLTTDEYLIPEETVSTKQVI